MFEEGPRCCENRNLLLTTSTVRTPETGDSYLIMGVRWLKASSRTAGGVLPQCCQINGSDSYRRLSPLQSDWSRCTQPLSCLTAGKWQKTEMRKFNPCIWQAGISGCVSNTERIEDLSKHSSFSSSWLTTCPWDTQSNEKNNRDVDCLQLDWVVNEITNARMLA